jgi:hypothetical protein
MKNYIFFVPIRLKAKVLSAKYNKRNSEEKSTVNISLRTTIERVKTLEAEKKNLVIEIDGLKKNGLCKSCGLESEGRITG